MEQRVGESVAEQLRPVARPRLYEVIVEQLCSYITDNSMTPGDRLPAERDLAEKLGVSRASLSQALVALEVQAPSGRFANMPTGFPTSSTRAKPSK